MTEGNWTYCDICWARILDAGYVDRGDLCDGCREFIENAGDRSGDFELDVVHVERLIV